MKFFNNKSRGISSIDFFVIIAAIELILVVIILSLLLGVVILSIQDIKNDIFLTKAKTDLLILEKELLAYRYLQNKTIFEITENDCSDCLCRKSINLSLSNNECEESLRLSFNKLGSNYFIDPWGSPYLISEGELVSRKYPCKKDILRSVGQDKKYGTEDDIIKELSFFTARCSSM